MYYILHGENEFLRAREIKKMRAEMGDPQFADLNTSILDGRRLTLSELQHTCDTIPFLTQERLVIVEGMLERLEARGKKKDNEESPEEAEVNSELAAQLKEYLPHLPPTTRLLFVEAKALSRSNPILKLALADKKGAAVREFPELDPQQIRDWIRQRVNEKGSSIQPDAVAELAAQVGSDLRLLDNEIEKLSIYCRDQPIRVQDVHELVTTVRESVIFDLVDAIGNRRTETALKLVHDQLNHKAEPLGLLGMIVRQFRILMQVKDLTARGTAIKRVAEQLRLNPFIAEKRLEPQSRNFTMLELDAAYQKLLDADLSIKTSRSDPVLALDLLIVDLTRR